MCGFKIYGLYPATDLLLEELAVSSASSKTTSVSSDTVDGEVKKNWNIYIMFVVANLIFHSW